MSESNDRKKTGASIIQIGALTITAKGEGRYKVHGPNGINLTLARQESGDWKASGKSSSGSYRRLTISALDAGSAALDAVERLHGLIDPAHEATRKLVKKPNKTIAGAFISGLEKAGRSKPRQLRLQKNAGYFIDWCDEQGLAFWEEVTDTTVTSYMKDVKARLLEKKGRVSIYTLKHYWEPINMTSAKMSLRHPAHYQHVTKLAGFPRDLATKARTVADKATRRALSIQDVLEFAGWLHDQEPYRQKLVTAVYLQALVGMRVQEAFFLRWKQVDLESGVLDIEDVDDHSVKTNESVRRVPLPRVVWDDLRSRARTGGRVLGHIPTWKALGKALEGAIEDWKKKGHIEPKGLRRTIPTHARRHRVAERWNDFYVELFIGHAAKGITDRHYVGYELEEIVADLRREVTDKIDQVVDRWKASKQPVSAQNCSDKEERPERCSARIVDLKAVV
ncbi:MAG: hypothetical protein PWP23_2255 [Candidatus Sumerlaeota bacterium]|nr:hypothetical protein [Candidatus Sumerlaeota bacterium]